MSLTHTAILVENDQKHSNLDKFRIKKVNKTHHLLVADIVMHHELDDNYQIGCFMYKKAGNDYKFLPFKLGPTNFCQFIKDEKMLYPDLQAVSDFPDIDTCPWPARTYHIFGLQPDLSKIPPILDNGDYMIECQLTQGEEVLQGFKVFGSVLIKVFG